MVAFDGSEPCARAEEYYHDFLDNENDVQIPPEVVDHIRQCIHCQNRLNRLRSLLGECGAGESVGRGQSENALIAELQSHFELLGEPLSCTQVKPFFPGLLDPSLKIRIPTPVTVHIDRCSACSKDLESLRALGLDADQLARLGRLYAEGSNSDLWACLRAQSRIAIVGSDRLERLDAETLDHLCVCPRCRNRLYQYRQKRLVRVRPQGLEQRGTECVDIMASDLFDGIIPYGKQSRSGESDEAKRCWSHVWFCPTCLDRAQHLHRTVYDVLERPDSGVVTVCTTRSNECEAAGVLLYEGYPIDVRVLGRESEPIVVESAGAGSGISARLRPIFRPAFMAAALIPLAIIFFLSLPSASGLNPTQVERMVREAPAVHVLVFGDDQVIPLRQMWASKAEQLLVLESVREHAVFDFAQGSASVVTLADGDVGMVHESAPVDLTAAERHMNSLLGLSMGQLLQETELERLEDVAEEGVRLEVYQLQWQGSNSIDFRWKVYVNPATHRPVKTEFSTWDRFEEQWDLDETRCFDYPDDRVVRQRADALLSNR